MSINDRASLGAFDGEDEDSGSEDEGEGEAGGHGVALQVEQERGEHVGRLQCNQNSSSISFLSIAYVNVHKKNWVLCHRLLHSPDQPSESRGRTR